MPHTENVQAVREVVLETLKIARVVNSDFDLGRLRMEGEEKLRLPKTPWNFFNELISRLEKHWNL